MAVDRITSDMRNMAQSYNSTKPVSLMQDKAREVKHSVRNKLGAKKSARETANAKVAASAKQVAKPPKDGAVRGATAAANSIQKGFEGLKTRNNQRHREVIGSMRERTNLLRGVNKQVGGMHNMMFKEMYGPKVEPYKRDEGAGVSQLADQLGQQHRDIMQELEKIRRAIIQSDGGGGFFGGGWRGGGGGGRNNKGGNNKGANNGGGSNTNNNNGGGNNRGWLRALANSKYGRIAAGVVTGGTAIATGMSIMDGPETPSLTSQASAPTVNSGSNSGTNAGSGGGNPGSYAGVSSSYTGVGSISAGNESTEGVYEISSGVGDHGGVSYGTHQLATETGSMAAFLQSPEGQPFAPAFRGTRPGTDSFNERYLQVASAAEQEFATAQSNYIKRTHYQPMFDNVSRGSGFDATGRGPAVKEMLYSTGVQYGTGTTVINRALEGLNPNSMSDADIITAVQNYKAATVDTYFKSSKPNIRLSVHNRAYMERDQLLAMDAEYQQQQELGIGEDTGGGGSEVASNTTTSSGPTPESGTMQDIAGADVESSTPTVASNSSGPVMDGAQAPSGAGTAVTAAAATALVGGGAAMSARSGPPPTIAAPSSPSKPAPWPSPTRPPAAISAPTPATSVASTPPASIASPSPSAADVTPDADKPSKWSRVRSGARRVPLISAGMGVYDVANIMGNDELSGGEKAGQVTDVAAGTVGGVAGGALAGAALGSVVPLVGTAIGGIIGGGLGYWGGSAASKAAREYVGEQAASRPDLPPNHPLANARRGEERRQQRNAEAEAEALQEEEEAVQRISADAVFSANQIAAIPPSAHERAALNTSQSSPPPVTARPATPAPAPASAESEEGGGDSALVSAMLSAVFGYDGELPSLENTRMEAPEHMRKNLHGYDNENDAPTVRPATQGTQDTYGAHPMSRVTGEDPFAEERQEPAGEPARPTTVREGNRVSHDFTNRPEPTRRNTGSEITDSDLNTRPVGSYSQQGAPSFRPEDQINLDVNAAHANMSVLPINARQASTSTPASVSRGRTAPASGTAPEYLGTPNSSTVSSSVPSSVRQQGSQSASGASDVSTQTVSDVPSQRQQYEAVQKVMMMEPQSQPKERQDLTKDARSPTTSSTFEGRNNQPSIDDTPALVSDFGLTLLNTGFI